MEVGGTKPEMTGESAPRAPIELKMPPSILSKRILCPAYIPAPFDRTACFKLHALHAMTTITVIARHLKLGYRLMAIEQGGSGYRIDLLFEAISSGRKRLDEVKSSKTIREVHRIQAALYAILHSHTDVDEIAVSNKETDEILSSEFIEKVRAQAELTGQFMINDPAGAATAYTPHKDCCYICGNTTCPFLDRTHPLTKVWD